MYRALRRALFRLEPERAHDVVIGGLALAGRSVLARRALERAYALRDPRLEVEVFGLRFPSPIGLAAGLDKDGVAVRSLAAARLRAPRARQRHRESPARQPATAPVPPRR